MLLLEPLGNNTCLSLRLFNCHSGLEAGNGSQVPRVAVRVDIGLRHRSVELALGINESRGQRLEVCIHDADDVVGATTERDCFANDIRIAAEAALPESVAQNNDKVFAVYLFFRRENAAKQGLAFHDFEETVADLNAGHSLGFAIS